MVDGIIGKGIVVMFVFGGDVGQVLGEVLVFVVICVYIVICIGYCGDLVLWCVGIGGECNVFDQY